MANASFTRDEVILTLDVLNSAGEDRLTKNSDLIISLCALLQELPIHPAEKRPPNFRNTVGVSDQIRSFREQVGGSERQRWGVGKTFFEVAAEFKDREDELHMIAEAIRRNREYFRECNFGQIEENNGFPEGALLSHLHRVIEARDSLKFPHKDRCEICEISVKEIYRDSESYTEYHLLEPVAQLDADIQYTTDDFICVCPNCHAALHRMRPWKTRETAKDILR